MSYVSILDYDPSWQGEFGGLANQIRATVGNSVLRIDHIGSTSIPGLAAKNIIDVQITVSDIEATEYATMLVNAGFRLNEEIGSDLLVGLPEGSPDLRKRFMREPKGQRRAHVHIREQGRINQRYPILFRDYLRANAVVCEAYSTVKRALASHFPDDVESYYSIKDVYMDTIYYAAEQWAELTDWNAGDPDA